MHEEWKMPHVAVGDTVMFSRDPGGSSGWTFGIVEEVGDRNICCWVPKCPDNWFRENVRHASDPIWQNERKRNAMLEDNDSGVFVLRPKDQAYEVLRQDYARLRALVEEYLPGIAPPAPEPEVPQKNKGGRPKGSKKKVPYDHMKPATYEEDELPDDVPTIEVDDDDERGNATLDDYVEMQS